MANPIPRSLKLPLRFSRPRGFHVVHPPVHGLPVGQSQLLDYDPTVDYQGGGVGLHLPPMRNPVSSSSSSSNLCNDSFGCDMDFQYQLTMSGLTGTCCTQFNRVWTLGWVSSGVFDCFWQEAYHPGACNPGGGGSDIVEWRSEFVIATSVVNLFFRNSTVMGAVGTTRAQYTISRASFDCDTGGTFSLASSTNCSGWPSSLPVSKV